ncbi:LLM class flavin-dependent oxidoreductase [Williamsia sp. 1135]|uniref:LLM class flavin-dependent oxidoreductase n=1 Tax=Williamsia sp. 1135 TaxID=1889262 RepID=UPI000A0FCE1A|nr:monooxygenase [Williamsia sp. 1135]
MRYGIVFPKGDAADFATMAVAAEDAGWDAVFGWEALWGNDPWISLTAAAMRTERIGLGTMLTPVPRRKPWDLASTTATLDRLSGGRVILGVGMGALHPGWLAFERDQGRKTRAELFDEGLDVLFGLWAGQPFEYSGKHYQVQPTDFELPDPIVSTPRITTWCVGLQGARKSMARAARCDGLLPNFRNTDGSMPDGPVTVGVDQWASIAAEIRGLREELGFTGNYDIVFEGTSDLSDRDGERRKAAQLADAGITWWLDSDWEARPADPIAYQLERIKASPPTF